MEGYVEYMVASLLFALILFCRLDMNLKETPVGFARECLVILMMFCLGALVLPRGVCVCLGFAQFALVLVPLAFSGEDPGSRPPRRRRRRRRWRFRLFPPPVQSDPGWTY